MFDDEQMPIDFLITPDSFMIDYTSLETFKAKRCVLEQNLEMPDQVNVVQRSENQAAQQIEGILLDKYLFLYNLGFSSEIKDKVSPSWHFLWSLSSLFHQIMADTAGIEEMREKISLDFSQMDFQDFCLQTPFIPGYEHVTPDWVGRQFNQLLFYFKQSIKSFEGSVSQYYEKHNRDLQTPERIYFHLVESKEEDYPFAFMATYTDQEGDQLVHRPLKYALVKYQHQQEEILKLLQPIRKVQTESQVIAHLLKTGEFFYPVRLTLEEAYQFLKDLPLYEEAHIKCRIPNWWKKKAKQTGVSLRLNDQEAYLSAENILQFRPQATYQGQELSKEELLAYLEMSEGLHLIKQQWVEIDHKQLSHLLERLEEMEEKTAEGLSLADVFKTMRKPDVSEGFGLTEADSRRFVQSLKERLHQLSQSQVAEEPKNFQATLRPYQKEGYRWLTAMTRIQLGICLADDMGLGKTVQILALLMKKYQEDAGPVLLILPTSLLGNWTQEIKKFSPDLPYSVYHGNAKELSEFLTITSYGTVRNRPEIVDQEWDWVILDEAQAIKNPNTKQAQAIQNLKSQVRMTLTGTPIENDLMDLYAIMNFTNPGLMGTMKDFKEFIASMKKEGGNYSRLKEMVSPFILRRLKTDKSIIGDLPDKIEMTDYVGLTLKQRVLYQEQLAKLKEGLAGAKGIKRKGLVLTSLLHLKQILNHPSQYTNDGLYSPKDSAKFKRLEEVAQQIYANREKVLIFTQYREMVEPLARFLNKVFHCEGLRLHGGTSAKERTKLVERFNSDVYYPYMVLSLKAGGTGLNLTAANHVIHFDRWWNPAVENQATDRAFRIGQAKNVFVHKFVSQGTVEEKIDQLLKDKQELADTVITANSAPALTEMSDKDLLDLFSLTD